MRSDERKTVGSAHHSSLITHRWAAVLLLAALLAACGSAPRRGGSERLPDAPPPTRGGGYYLDDGPGAGAPTDIAAIPDAVPRIEPLYRGTMRPYTVMGRSYAPMTELAPYKARAASPPGMAAAITARRHPPANRTTCMP